MVASGEWLARKLLELEQQVQALSRGTRLGNSSLQGESILALDEDGEVLAELGTEGGAGGVVHLDGPEPPRPTAPVLEQGVGTIFVRWDGAWHPLDDEDEQPTTPIDFDRIEVHATTDPEATEWDEDTLAGSITQRNGGVVMIRGWDIDDVVYVRLVCRSLADKLSEPSERAEVTVTGIDIAAIVDELDAANLELSNLDGTMFAVGAELDALAITFKNLDASIINTDDGTLADALDEARQALEAVQQTAEGKNRITRSLEGPPAEYDGVENDLWWQLDSLGQGGAVVGQWRWNGTEWVGELLDSAAIAYLDAAKITAGTLEADRIATGSIGARAIAADAVEAGKIAADSISGREIIANTVKAEHIVSFTITADELAANSVSTDKLVANSVIADKLAANSVIAEKIEALAVTADKIAANAITADKIAANAITAGKIEAGAVTGEVLSADALNFKRGVGMDLVSASIRAGDSVEITEEYGFRQFGPDGALNVDFPSDGSPASVRGDFSARRLTAQQMQLTGPTTIASGADVVIESGVTAPAAAPQVTPYWGRITMPPLTDREQAVGIAWGEGHWWRLVTTSVPLAEGGRTQIEKISPDGQLVDTITTTYRTNANGITYLNGELYVLAAALSVSGDGTTPTRPRMVVVYGTDGVEQRRWEYPAYGTGTYQPGIGTDGTDIVIAQCWKTGALTYRRYSPTGVLVAQHDTPAMVGADMTGFVSGDLDYGGFRTVFAVARASQVGWQFLTYTGTGAALTYQRADSWTTPGYHAPTGLAWDGTHLWSLDPDGNLVRYARKTVSGFVGDHADDWWMAVSWRNDPAETLVGPAVRFTYPHRAQLLVTVPDTPQGVSGIAFFVAKGESAPSRTQLHWAQEINHVARTSLLPSLASTWAMLRNPVGASSFTDSEPGEIRSALSGFRVDGTGAGEWGPLRFGADGSLRGAGTIITGQVEHPSIAAGNLNSHDVTITFPAGRFTTPPVIMLSHTNGLVSPVPSAGTVTKDSFQMRVWNPHETRNAGAGTVYWAAIERTH